MKKSPKSARKGAKGRKFLAIIPARGGSTRIKNKNIRLFNGKPLISYTIKQAFDCGFFDRVIVDTDDEKIAAVAKRYGAEVPFLRPPELAKSASKIGDVIVHLLDRLKKAEGYVPDVIAILQTTSPLREVEDIEACRQAMLDPKVKSASTVCETSPWFFHITKNGPHKGAVSLVNKEAAASSNTQEVEKGYLLNGCMVFMLRTDYFLKIRKLTDMTGGGTVAVICPRWRSVDLDHPEDWIVAELLHKNFSRLKRALKNFK